MKYSGTLSEIQKKIKDTLDCMNNITHENIEVVLSISRNGKELVMIDKTEPLHPITDILQLTEAISSNNIYILEKEIYSILTKQQFPSYSKNSLSPTTLFKQDLEETEDNNKPISTNYKTGSEKNKTVITLQKTNTPQEQTSKRLERSNKTTAVTNEFIIEQYISDDEQIKKPCVIGIKRIENNLYYAYYRSSVYDKGSDTNFRHYLASQPGNLAAYIYFRKIENLRELFSSLGKRLRKNGNNCLSLSQVSQIVSTLTSIQIY